MRRRCYVYPTTRAAAGGRIRYHLRWKAKASPVSRRCQTNVTGAHILLSRFAVRIDCQICR